ncbi:MAG: bis(5'-nucleosyl)-tetraphosphatase (symmetrical) YqeK [Clostridia bacterium]|nr:bis(5'-nucleosyl)-tetraphosphatase (symmetrical) YqeK [Clostridia bacterium]
MCDGKQINEEMLNSLRQSLENKKNSGGMSEKRYRHTIEVEKMVARLAHYYAPEKELILRAAALLHDLTKEYSLDMQIMLCARFGIAVTVTDYHAPKTFHAKTAAALIESEYPDFADGEVVDCVRWHTTGRAGMTLCEKLVYLADYIDMSRTFEDCVRLREYFFGADIDNMSSEQRLAHLDDTLVLSFDMTMRGLLDEGVPISPDTVAARNELAVKRIERK